MASVRGSLEEPGVEIDLEPGQLSGPIDLGEKGVFRVSLTSTSWSEAFNQQVYALLVTDENGGRLAGMSISSNTTATFKSLGVQVYVLAQELPVF